MEGEGGVSGEQVEEQLQSDWMKEGLPQEQAEVHVSLQVAQLCQLQLLSTLK